MPSSSVLILPFHPQLSLLFPFTAGGIKADINPGFPYFPLWQAAQAPASPAKYVTFRNNTTHWILQWSMLQFVELYSSAEILIIVTHVLARWWHLPLSFLEAWGLVSILPADWSFVDIFVQKLDGFPHCCLWLARDHQWPSAIITAMLRL